MAHAWREFFHEHTGRWPEDHWAFGGRRFKPWHQGIDAYNPFIASLLSKGGGLLPLIVLDVLADAPRYGNEIMDRIAERTGGHWIANPGAIYPLMTALEAEGFVEGEWEGPDKRTVRIYRLTEAGEAELARMRTIVRPRLEEAVTVLQNLIEGLGADDETEEYI
jgi:PadR family transcriptional regulator PadR